MMSCPTTYLLNINYPQLARNAGFSFNKHKPKIFIDWNVIGLLNIDRIIQERDVSTIDDHINYVIDYQLDKEEMRILDPNFVKLFQLAQLSIEYLLFCKHYLDMSISQLQKDYLDVSDKNEQLTEELLSKNKTVVKLLKRIKEFESAFSRPVTTNTLSSNSNVIPTGVYNCSICAKSFMTEAYLEAHFQRRHSGETYVPPENSPAHELYKIETDRLNLEIKQLKERLNDTERILNDEKNVFKEIEKNEPNNDLIKCQVSPENNIQTQDFSTQCNINKESETGMNEKTDFQTEIIQKELEKWKANEQSEFLGQLESLKMKIYSEMDKLRVSDSKESGDYVQIQEENAKEMKKSLVNFEDRIEKKLQEKIAHLEQELIYQEQRWRDRITELEKQQPVFPTLREKMQRLVPSTINVVHIDTDKSEEKFSLNNEKTILPIKAVLRRESKVFESPVKINDPQSDRQMSEEKSSASLQQIREEIKEIIISENTDESSEIIAALKSKSNSDSMYPKKISKDTLIDISENMHLKNKNTVNKTLQKNIIDDDEKENIYTSEEMSEETENDQRTVKRHDASAMIHIIPDKQITNSDAKANVSKSKLSPTPLTQTSDRSVHQKYNEVVKQIFMHQNAKNMSTSSESEDDLSIFSSESDDIIQNDNKTIDKENESRTTLSTLAARSITSMELAIQNDKYFLPKFRKTIESVVSNKLRDIGVDPDWNTLPNKNFKQQMATLQHSQSLTAKTFPTYFDVREDILVNLEKNIKSQRSVKIPLYSSDSPESSESIIIEKELKNKKQTTLLSERNSAVRKMKSRVLSMIKPNEKPPSSRIARGLYKLTIVRENKPEYIDNPDEIIQESVEREKALLHRNPSFEIVSDKIQSPEQKKKDPFVVPYAETSTKNVKKDSKNEAKIDHETKAKSMYAEDSESDSYSDRQVTVKSAVNRPIVAHSDSDLTVKREMFTSTPVKNRIKNTTSSSDSPEVKLKTRHAARSVLKTSSSAGNLAKKHVLFDLQSKPEDDHFNVNTTSDNAKKSSTIKENNVNKVQTITETNAKETNKLERFADPGDTTSISSSVFDGSKTNLTDGQTKKTFLNSRKQSELNVVNIDSNIDSFISDFEFSSS